MMTLFDIFRPQSSVFCLLSSVFGLPSSVFRHLHTAAFFLLFLLLYNWTRGSYPGWGWATRSSLCFLLTMFVSLAKELM